jgi:hypothetical protein
MLSMVGWLMTGMPFAQHLLEQAFQKLALLPTS